MVLRMHDLVFIGSLTQPTPYFANSNGRGVGICRFDRKAGRLDPIGETNEIVNPTWLTVDAGRKRLFACSEVFEWDEGSVTAFGIEGERLIERNKQPSGGSITGYAAADRSGRSLL